MANDDKSRADRTTDQVRQRAKGSDDRPFDMWLQKQLHAMYDEIASEPLPNELLNLIDHDADKAGDRNDEPAKGAPGNKK